MRILATFSLPFKVDYLLLAIGLITVEGYVSLDSLVIERESYSLLEWLGDIGGLLDAQFYICRFLVGPIATFRLKSLLLSSVFRR